MRLLIVFTVAALACAQVFAAPQIHNNYNDPSQVHVVDNNYNDPSQVHVVDNNYNDPSQVHIVDNYYNDPTQVHVVDNNPHEILFPGQYRPRSVVEDSAFYRPTQNGNGDRIVEDPGFYRPTQNGNSHIVEDSAFYRPTYGGNQHGPIDPGFYRPGNQNNYEPISNGPAFVEDGRKHYDNPNLRSGK
ncbi:uncharacterized protein LOC111002652 isoform X4 [Pieris rapae]|uniref:uncharacterized protein LOC111002652 isoform X4 n=1 Tax=Pieris rapae TaxID=64459 RepID=UPI001E28049E|nr:uncharacterized protein LOC111002652 isoform X4 [Pieris rapae]